METEGLDEAIDDWSEGDFDEERPTLVDALERHSVSLPSALPAERNRALLTVLTGPERGNVFKLPQGEARIGRSDDSHVTLADQALSRIHARIRPVVGGFILTDNGSTNGTFVDEERISQPVRIEAGMRFRLGKRTIVVVNLHDELEESAAISVHEAALRDRLTGVYNRGVFDDRLKSELAFAKRHRSPLSVLLFDIDHFKKFNDEHGHLTGDAVLIAVGEAVGRTVRTEDIFARYGGEEFAVIARDTPKDKGLILAERIRVAIEACRVEADVGVLHVTASVGVATLADATAELSGSALVEYADRALYSAKRAGRNCVVHVASLLNEG